MHAALIRLLYSSAHHHLKNAQQLKPLKKKMVKLILEGLQDNPLTNGKSSTLRKRKMVRHLNFK